MATKILRPLYTASTWRTLWQAVFDSFWSKPERRQKADDGTNAPKLTNREAAALVREWHNVAPEGAERGEVWYQFVASAYGWDPPRRDYMRRDEAQASGWYPRELTKDLWSWAWTIALYADDIAGQPPRFAPQLDSFEDPVFAGTVRACLLEDGAEATFKFPTGYCKDKKTGKKRVPLPKCDAKGRGPYLGVDKSGKPVYGACDKPGDCEPEFWDDPFTVSGKNLATFLFWLGAAWLVLTPNKRRRR